MNKKPRNKKESDILIDALNLNRVSEIAINYDDYPYDVCLEMARDFIHETGYLKYGMRSLYPSGPFMYAVHKKDVLQRMDLFSTGVKICESMYVADTKNMVLQGFIRIDKEFNIICEANDIPGISLRQSMADPKYKWYFSELEGHLPRSLAITGVVDLMVKHELFDVVVEFTYYDVPVGRHQEKLLIWEIRNY